MDMYHNNMQKNDKEGYNIKLKFSRKDCNSILYDLVKHCEKYSYDEEPKYDFIGEELKKNCCIK